MKNKTIIKAFEKRLKIIKLLIVIHYIHEIRKALIFKKSEPAKNNYSPHSYKNSSFSIHNSELLPAFEDPIGTSGGLNLYRAFGNNPVEYIDPWGLRSPGPGYYLSGYYSYWATVRGAIKQKWDTESELSCCILNCVTGVNICCKGKGTTKTSPLVSFASGSLATLSYQKFMVKYIVNNRKLIETSLLSKLIAKKSIEYSLTSNIVGVAVLAGQGIYCSIKCSIKR